MDVSVNVSFKELVRLHVLTDIFRDDISNECSHLEEAITKLKSQTSAEEISEIETSINKIQDILSNSQNDLKQLSSKISEYERFIARLKFTAGSICTTGYVTKHGDFEESATSTRKTLKSKGIDYNPVVEHTNTLSEDEIIHLVAGGDMTSGSCASVALAYAGQKQGWNVLDFRGGDSMDFFSDKLSKVKMFRDLGAKSIVSDSANSSLVNGKLILTQLNEGVEYYLSVGRHAAIVRNNGGVLQYLELQSPNPNENGWVDFGNVEETLKDRFGCSNSALRRRYSTAYATDISQLSGDNFRTILGYINTNVAGQKKGGVGSVK